MGGKIIDRLMRRKYISSGELAESSLKRTLTTLDLTALGIGSTLGVGVYVLAGDVAKNSAGPSVVLSFAIAAIASVFAGLCYAEFGARVPRAGSAYVYSYVCVGELIAFIIGWNLILEYVIGTASVARGYSNYLDSLFDKKMQSAFRNITPIHDWLDSPTASEYLSSYFDFFALGICILLSLLLSFGVKESSKFNNVFTVLNLLVVVYVIIIGSFKADIKNWQIEPEEVENSGNYNVGDGGFFPFGINGMLSGAATCFYGFIGFDAVATTGEETKNPQRSIPIAIVVSLTFIFLAYFGISTVLTMMWPYYDQDPNSPLPTVFEAIGWPSAKWIVSIGALFGLSTSLLGAMFPLPRVVYAMAKDGLIFRFLAKVHSKYQTPMLATLLSGTFGGILAAIFDLNALVDMMSIGTLLAYTLVAHVDQYLLDDEALGQNLDSLFCLDDTRKFLDSLVRRKYMNPDEMVETSLKRTLNALDLTLLGIGSTLGVGVYVLAGDVAKNTAGPSVVLSFAIAAIASVFAGFCYAEFGARVPRAGSAYIYSYVCVGEFIAFIIGWTLILEYMIGTASVARGYSNYLDALFNKKMQAAFHEITPIHEWIDNPTVAEYLSPYLDFFAFAICVFLTLLLCFGVKESSKFNSVFTCLNLLVVVYVVIIGSINAKVKNWQIKPEEVQNPGNKLDIGDGGFFPFGINGMLSGAATCFYGFIGFDCVATTGEETKNPQRAIPIAIVVSLTFIFLAYFGVSTVLTMMWPYYDQDPYSPLPTVFEAIGWSSAKWVVSIGALFGLSTSLLGTMFPLPRVVYAMANDGLIFRCFSKVNARFKTPVIATLVSGTCGGILAAIFELSSLVDMMSIGTLLAYTLVAMCVLILSKEEVYYSKISSSTGVCFIGVNGILIFQEDSISGKSDAKWPIVLLVIFILMSLITVVIISRQPMNKHKLHFKVPLVPFLPAVSIWINIYLMMKLSDKTWIRFSVWMILGECDCIDLISKISLKMAMI
ncbi:unnamed protein product [Notodromas monacha]|uniref:Cationic amino acid transporter C-terminal domain-containing protein n=1 Tax=Notodromas monacha TaxID=399045 RepID=A0A7R9BIN7_9CRUS|nr:unnamed protein product [Notodromas monacha]CAG0914823.1 unnamed protein product [Notodromas monacha]